MKSMKRQKDMTLKDEFPRSVGAQYATGKRQTKSSRGMKRLSEVETTPGMDVSGGESKVRCCKQQYCIGTWNIRSMNHSKLEVVKQEMTRVNVDILGISELKWTRMGEFNSDNCFIYYCEQETLRRNRVALIVNERVQNAVLGCNRKRQNDLCSFPRQTIQYHSSPRLWPQSLMGRSWCWMVYEDLHDLLDLIHKKDVLSITGDWNVNVGSQEIPEVRGKFGLGAQNEAGKRLREFCQENAMVTANTIFQQHKIWLYTWHHQVVSAKIRLIIFFAAKDGEALYSQQKQDQELTVAQIMNSILQNSDSNWKK